MKLMNLYDESDMKTSLIDTYLQTSSEEAKKSEAPAFLEHLLERIRLHISKG
jgi:hypothetical protein